MVGGLSITLMFLPQEHIKSISGCENGRMLCPRNRSAALLIGWDVMSRH